MKTQSITIKDNQIVNLTKDNVYPQVIIKDLSELTGLPVRRGIEKAIISGGALVNTVSKSYGLLKNEDFFFEVESQLDEAGIKYETRSVNRENRSFAVDYILNDPSYVIKVKNSKDEIIPMIRCVNSYDYSCKTAGYFGFFRKVCNNGLHVNDKSMLSFTMKHRGDVGTLVLPKIKNLVEQFIANEYYSLSKRFEVLAERPILSLEGWVSATAQKTGLFKFQKSEKNAEPSLNASLVIETIEKEAALLGIRPNAWLGYNAFNELLHGKLKKTFDQQIKLDEKLFNAILV